MREELETKEKLNRKPGVGSRKSENVVGGWRKAVQ